ncbi:MAG: hypothetical protein SFV15_12580 [Polyangiaceae bacterium]|nr:hypothetical protein [Polyangiaceae bacterium]
MANSRRLSRRLLLALVAICLAHLYLKGLQVHSATLTTFLPLPPDALSRPWQLLLPLRVSNAPGGDAWRWSTTGLVPVSALDLLVGAKVSYLCWSLANVVSVFVCSWVAFRSAVFTVTATICMAFGSQFDYALVNSGCASLLPMSIWLQLNLLSLVLLWRHPARSSVRILYASSLVLLALAFETWLDYLAALTTALAWAFVVHRSRLHAAHLAGLRFVAIATSAITLSYLVLKVALGGAQEHLRPGQEAELVVGYFRTLPLGKAAVITLEDLLSNLVTYLYVSLTNYLPPFLLASNSLIDLGRDTIIAQQFGYHAEYQKLTYAHHLFLWYFQAGAVAALFAQFLRRAFRRAHGSYPSVDQVVPLFCSLMVLFGASTHMLIKYRPYLSVPLLSYKCFIGVMGTTLLLSWVLSKLPERFGVRRGNTLVAAGWLGIVAAGLLRPAWLGELAKHVGLGSIPPPW